MRFYCENCGSRYESDKVSGGQKVRCKKCNSTFAVVQADEKDSLLGQQVGGCRLIRKLGQGGMGSVYRAYMLSLDKAVAIKILSSELGNNEEFIQRFFREARAAAKLEHHNIVQVLNVGEDKSQRLHYIIMQFVDGQALTRQIRQRGRIPQLEALDLIEQVANGLKCAHDKGFIHRDIKPDNIMISSDGIPKVADFGLAKSLEETAHLTTTGTIMGTPHYMSPEQCKGEELDPRSDLYSLGVVLYEMLSGHLPFTAPSPVSVMMKHTTEEPKSIREIAPDLHPEIEALVKSMMVKDPQKRLQNCAELLERVKQIRGLLQQPVKNIFQPSAETVYTPPPPVSEKVAELTNPPISTAEKARIPLAIWIAFASVGVVLLVILILLLRRPGAPEHVSKNPQPSPAEITADIPTASQTSVVPPSPTEIPSTPSPAPPVNTDVALSNKFADAWKHPISTSDLSRLFPETTLAVVNFFRFDRFKGKDVPAKEAPGEIEKGVFNLWLNPLCDKLSAITENYPDLFTNIDFVSGGFLDNARQIVIFRFKENSGHEKLFAEILARHREYVKVHEGLPVLNNEKTGEFLLFAGNTITYFSNESALDESLKCYLAKDNNSGIKNNNTYRTMFNDVNHECDLFAFITSDSGAKLSADPKTVAMLENALQLSSSSGVSLTARAHKNNLECRLHAFKKKISAPEVQPIQFESLNWLPAHVPFQVCIATKDAKKSLVDFFRQVAAFYKPFKAVQNRIERQAEKRGLNPEDDYFPFIKGECGVAISNFEKKEPGDKPEQGNLVFGTTNDAAGLKNSIDSNIPLIVTPAEELSSEKGQTYLFKMRPGAKKLLNGPGIRGGYIIGKNNWTALTANMPLLKQFAPSQFPKSKLLKDEPDIPATFINAPANMLLFFDIKPLLKIQLKNEPRRMLCVKQVQQEDAVIYNLIIPIEKFLE